MEMTLEELKEKLASQFDEVTLIEMLNASAEDIVEAFEDRIISRYTYFSNQVED